MRFFLQPGITLDDAPRPLAPRIRVVPVPEQRMAVITFRAGWMSRRLHEHERVLSAAVSAAGWQVAGAVVMLFYGVPFATSLPRLTEIAAPVSPRSA
jgi:SOUL heme-binding protein